MDAGDWENQDDNADDMPDEDAPTSSCPACSSGAVWLGMLGRWDWFRCRQCGQEFHA